MILISNYCYKLTRSLYIKDILDFSERISQQNAEFIWSYFMPKDMSLVEEKVLLLAYQKLIHFSTALMEFIFEALSNGIIFLLW